MTETRNSITGGIIESRLLSREGNMDVIRNIVDRLHHNVYAKTRMINHNGQESKGMVFMDDVLSLLQYATIVAKIDNEIVTAKQIELLLEADLERTA